MIKNSSSIGSDDIWYTIENEKTTTKKHEEIVRDICEKLNFIIIQKRERE